jgi:hypothetical protein
MLLVSKKALLSLLALTRDKNTVSWGQSTQLRVQIQKEVISDLKRENQLLYMGVYMIDLKSEICKPVLKLDFTAHL